MEARSRRPDSGGLEPPSMTPFYLLLSIITVNHKTEARLDLTVSTRLVQLQRNKIIITVSSLTLWRDARVIKPIVLVFRMLLVIGGPDLRMDLSRPPSSIVNKQSGTLSGFCIVTLQSV